MKACNNALLVCEGYRLIIVCGGYGFGAVQILEVGKQPLNATFTANVFLPEQQPRQYVHRSTSSTRFDPAAWLGVRWEFCSVPPAVGKNMMMLVTVRFTAVVPDAAPSRKRPRVADGAAAAQGGEIEEDVLPPAKAARASLVIDLADAMDGETLEEAREKPED
jgi:hypothetical protein